MKRLLLLFSAFLLFASFAFSADWFVRPLGGSYGLKDGSSYDNAWDGLGRINWSGISPGDTVFVCGFHDAGYNDNRIIPTVSGTSNAPITISGNCPGDLGSVFSAGYRFTSGWLGPDAFGVYSRPYGGSTGSQMFEGSVRLSRETKNPDSSWKPGSFYQNYTEKILYYKPSAGSASDYVVYTLGATAIPLTNVSFINIEDLSLKNASEIIKLSTASNILIKNNHIQYAPGNCISLWYNSDHVSIVGNIIENCGNGIYTINQGGPNSDNSDYVRVANNIIRNINQDYYSESKDSHSIGVQGGNNSIYEDNQLYNIGGSGITLYTSPGQELKNTIVRNNYVHDVYDLGYALVGKLKRNERGIEYGNTNAGFKPDDVTNNLMYNNIIANVGGLGLYNKGQTPTSGYSWIVANNTVYKAGICFSFNDYPDGNSGFKFINNICSMPTQQHIDHVYKAGDVYGGIDMNYNIYSPDGSRMFDWKNILYDFNAWKQASGQDKASRIADLLFVNAAAGDFKLQSNSPAINAGQDLSSYFNNDFNGILRPQGNAWDIGAYEVSGGGSSQPLTCSSGRVLCNNQCVTPACSTNLQCNDSNVLTTDVCLNAGVCGAVCDHVVVPNCGSGQITTQCACVNPDTGQKDLYSSGMCCSLGSTLTYFTAGCLSNAACNDNNLDTVDACVNAGVCPSAISVGAYCTNTLNCSAGQIVCNNACTTPACSSNSQCNDGNSSTTDTCLNPSTCGAVCSNIVVSLCGNGLVDSGENCSTCAADVVCASGQVCSLGVCKVPDTGTTGNSGNNAGGGGGGSGEGNYCRPTAADADGDCIPRSKDCNEFKRNVGECTGCQACAQGACVDTSACFSAVPGIDTDGDGLTDEKEDSIGTDKTKIDTDADFVSDAQEIADKTNPLDSKSNKFSIVVEGTDAGKGNEKMITVVHPESGVLKTTLSAEITYSDGKTETLQSSNDGEFLFVLEENRTANVKVFAQNLELSKDIGIGSSGVLGGSQGGTSGEGSLGASGAEGSSGGSSLPVDLGVVGVVVLLVLLGAGFFLAPKLKGSK